MKGREVDDTILKTDKSINSNVNGEDFVELSDLLAKLIQLIL